jgi:hypothetical protein
MESLPKLRIGQDARWSIASRIRFARGIVRLPIYLALGESGCESETSPGVGWWRDQSSCHKHKYLDCSHNTHRSTFSSMLLRPMNLLSRSKQSGGSYRHAYSSTYTCIHARNDDFTYSTIRIRWFRTTASPSRNTRLPELAKCHAQQWTQTEPKHPWSISPLCMEKVKTWRKWRKERLTYSSSLIRTQREFAWSIQHWFRHLLLLNYPMSSAPTETNKETGETYDNLQTRSNFIDSQCFKGISQSREIP